MHKPQTILELLAAILALIISCSALAQSPADLILHNAQVYTMETDNPWASAVVIRGNLIVAVLNNNAPIKPWRGPNTKVVDLKGRFVLPGFIDGHVHFDGAGAQINGADLLTVSDRQGLRAEIQRVVDILDSGEWITGGSWGAYEQWALGASRSHKKKNEVWRPNRRMIDDITQDNPCLLNNYNRQMFLANSKALAAANLSAARLPGMESDKDGRPTGLLYRGSPAIKKIREVIKPKSHKRLLDENRAGLKALREAGIVEIHDVIYPDQTARYIELQEKGELTTRVWLRPDLARGAEMKKKKLYMGLHPKTKQPHSYLRYGAFKGYIDGIMGNHSALFFKPYNDRPDVYGRYRRHTSDDPNHETGNMEKVYNLLKLAHDAGFVANVHAIGTKGVALMLDTYERLMKDLGGDLEGYRIIHAQVIRSQDFPRFKKLNVIAEVNPYHLADDMRWMEERIGHQRSKGAYAFKSLLDNGAILSFGSDWPGTSAAKYHVHPKYLIHAAVNRTTINGEPKGGWFPEQKISVHEALKAYTINNAYAAFENNIRGSIKVGKLADITVCDRNLLKINPKDILKMNVDMTIVDGKVVYQREM